MAATTEDMGGAALTECEVAAPYRQQMHVTIG